MQLIRISKSNTFKNYLTVFNLYGKVIQVRESSGLAWACDWECFFAPDTIKPLGQIPKFLLKGGAPQFYILSIARKEMADNSSKKQNKTI